MGCFGWLQWWGRKSENVDSLYKKGLESNSLYEASQEDARLTEATGYYARALAAADPQHPHRPNIFVDLIFALLNYRNRTRAHISAVEEYFYQVCNEYPEKLTRKQASSITIQLGTFYENIDPSDMRPGDIERCISYYTKAADYADSLQDQISWVLVVADLQAERMEEAHFYKALDALRTAKALCPLQYSDDLLNISNRIYEVLKNRYLTAGRRCDLEDAIAECEYLLHTRLQHDDTRLLLRLARCNWVLLDVHGRSLADRRTSEAAGIHYCRRVLHLLANEPNTDPTKRDALIILANVLAHGQARPGVEDLTEAIELYRQAKVPEGEDVADWSRMADAIWLHCRKTDIRSGLDEAIAFYSRALSKSGCSRITANDANNIAAIYLEKANNTDIEALEHARMFYLQASRLALEAVDQDYFRAMVDKITVNINILEDPRTSNVSPMRRFSGERRSTISSGGSL
ncbi:hypothetical protein DFP72DRAFT_871614 [Ephemerocybe angulata]|uniref:Uncharacterized protein n=1 Tax=Ephemerocybe angulata TaxID=980116 RepID=A0A8H6MCN4_9AGAR|nr:hypothetical protein DFP72DRAFT_871614 [Tulosesus angulatus]